MQPSDSQRQIADRVRNQVRNTGKREMSPPSFSRLSFSRLLLVASFRRLLLEAPA